MKRLESFVAGSMVVLIFASSALADTARSPAALRETYSSLKAELEHNAFNRPLRLVSTHSADTLTGDIHAVIDHPFEQVRSALGTVKNWCDIMILHPNMTNCQAKGGGTANPAQSLTVSVGRSGSPAEFAFRVAASQPDYLNVQLSADEGPLGTKDFRIMFEGTPLDTQRTFVHFVFSHAFGMQAQIAMRAYLSTLGRNKVGFTVIGKKPDGEPVYVGDFRGALERNAMRYYLAIEAYLDTASTAPSERFEKRLQAWYASAERYPLQLHEEPAYLDLKREIARARS